MRFLHEMAYDADPDSVYAMLADAAFREEVCEYQQVLRHSVAVAEVDGVLCVDVDQVQVARHIPAFAQPFVGPEIEIAQREAWHSPTDATLEVTVPGKPVRMVGTISLRVLDSRTVETVAGEIRVSLPLIGGRVEELVGDVLRLALNAENAVGQRWING